MAKRATPAAWPRILGLVAAYEVGAVTGPGVLIWVIWFGAADLGVFIAMMLARIVLAYVQLRTAFDPVRRWRAHEGRLDDEQLLDTDRRLQQAPRRFAWGYTIGLVVALSLATALGQIGVPTHVPVGRSELMMLGLLLLGLSFGIGPILTSMLDPVLLEARAAIGTAIATRGLEARRVPASFIGWSARLNIPYTLMIFYCTAAIIGMVAIDGWRNAGLSQLQLRTIAASAQLRAGEEPDEALARVEPAELPPLLTATEGLDAGPLAGFDVERNMLVVAAPTDDGGWIVAEEPARERAGIVFAFALGLPLLFVVPMLIANLAVTRAQTRQLVEVRTATQRILASGGIGEIERFRPPHNDELGLLVRDFNTMLDVLEELASAAAAVAAGDLTVELDRPGDFHDAFRGMLSRLQEAVGQIHATAVELASAAATMQHGVREQERVVEEQSRSMTDVSATVERLAAAAADITQTAASVLDNAERTREHADSMVERITALTSQAGDIGQLLESVREIAGRSDLLALNGSLEATRAGQAGRGFALVAAEMRRLAERVAATVVDMQTRVVDIGRAGTSTVMATDETRKLAEATAAAARQISTVTASQSQNTRRVSDTMHEVIATVTATAEATAVTRDSAEALARRAEALERLTSEFEVS